MRLAAQPTPTLDADLAASAKGMRAAVLHGDLKGLFADREEMHLRKLIAEHHAGTLTEPAMRSGIAAIAEGRAVLDDLARTMRHGDAARHRATQPPRDSRTGA